MRVTREYLCLAKSRSEIFRAMHRRNGWRGGWVYWADGAGGMGMGSTAREAVYDARKRTGL